MVNQNKHFDDEQVTDDDLYFMCYMIERVARNIKQRNKYVVNKIGRDELWHLISLANVMHCENPLAVEDRWIKDYGLEKGTFDITDVDRDLARIIPHPLDMGDVYRRLILDTRLTKEDYADGIVRVYNDPICETIDNYNASAFYEPSYVVARAYFNKGF